MRRHPYTDAGLRRVRCGATGCDLPATEQWMVRSCKVGGPDRWIAVCERCDTGLNDFVRHIFALEAS